MSCPWTAEAQRVIFEESFDRPQQQSFSSFVVVSGDGGADAGASGAAARDGDGGLRVVPREDAGNQMWYLERLTSPETGRRYLRSFVRVQPFPEARPAFIAFAPGLFGTGIGHVGSVHIHLLPDAGLRISCHTTTRLPSGSHNGVQGALSRPFPPETWVMVESWFDAFGSSDAGHTLAIDGVVVEQVRANWNGVATGQIRVGQYLNFPFSGVLDFDEVVLADAPLPSTLVLTTQAVDGGTQLLVTARSTFPGGFVARPIPLSVEVDGGLEILSETATPTITALDQPLPILLVASSTGASVKVAGRGLVPATWFFQGADAGEPGGATPFRVGCDCSSSADASWFAALLLLGAARRRCRAAVRTHQRQLAP